MMKAPSIPQEGSSQTQPSTNGEFASNTVSLQSEVQSDASANPPLRGAGADYYLNEKGLVTFTSNYLLERGYCCGNGCKHCPYNYEAVPEPKRSYLLAQKENKDSTQ